MRRVKAFLLPVMVCASVATLLGCSSPKGIAVNQQQTVVMDSSVLTAGILASQPAISTSAGTNVARSVISNSQNKPVKINYRFYWYDAQGLEVPPLEAPRAIIIAPGDEADVQSVNNHFNARSARLYLFL
ncbi:YcfL family protein [Yersinia aleksiciae]|uniref:Membrane protein n=1 Tax=Yersinia aleksiciae TaxID=263819 RepID=A0A0T9U1G2_YERAE|nr:YcfL family protein [Yersinia aleksiciae]AKP35155.1 membrane protein [Yersinia aleksiciae]MDA5496712.1 YcfL family protein [Yersinia aleksiciae]NIK97530.1 YcfL family protein [Yersinia aleksiciae]WQC69302.1 YcfL family protein [Yersinia aleksiciae]CFQ39355.1 putative lipoprotein [Yersinia aleksiciae]